MKQHLGSFIIGIILFPLLVLIFRPLVIFVFPVIYGFGGCVIGKKFSDKYIINSLLFGIGPILWSAIFLYGMGWVSEVGGGGFILILALATPLVSLVGAKVAVDKLSVNQ